MYDVMKDDTPLYMFCGSDKVDFFKQQIEKRFTVKNIIVWDKGNHTAGDLEAQYGKRYEFIIYANKGRAKFNPDMPRYEDIWKFARVTGKEQIHQNQKPTDLLSRIINQHTRRGDLVLDPFAGSGSTAVAAYRLQRDYIGFEIDDEYYEAGNRRLAAVRSQLSIKGLQTYKRVCGTRENNAIVYMLTNYDTTIEEDLYRLRMIKQCGFLPDVRIYRKPAAPQILRDLQRWCNNRILYRSCDFMDYVPRADGKTIKQLYFGG